MKGGGAQKKHFNFTVTHILNWTNELCFRIFSEAFRKNEVHLHNNNKKKFGITFKNKNDMEVFDDLISAFTKLMLRQRCLCNTEACTTKLTIFHAFHASHYT